jgi:hypothetical protein
VELALYRPAILGFRDGQVRTFFADTCSFRLVGGEAAARRRARMGSRSGSGYAGWRPQVPRLDFVLDLFYNPESTFGHSFTTWTFI